MERPLTVRDAANQEVWGTQPTPLWRGVPVDKCAFDLLLYQEMIVAFRPDIVIETGTWRGGSALFFADLCEMQGHGEVMSIDREMDSSWPAHPRLTYLCGDSVAPGTRQLVDDWANGRRGLVVLDSDHSKAHVLAELDAYAPLVGVGQYLVVEDTNINGHPLELAQEGGGPWEAVQEWIGSHPEFVIDRDVEPYVTFCPSGYLRRMRDEP